MLYFTCHIVSHRVTLWLGNTNFSESCGRLCTLDELTVAAYILVPSYRLIFEFVADAKFNIVQHFLSTFPFNIPFQHFRSTFPFNISSQYLSIRHKKAQVSGFARDTWVIHLPAVASVCGRSLQPAGGHGFWFGRCYCPLAEVWGQSFHTEKLTLFFHVFLKRLTLLTLRLSKVSKLRFAKARGASGKACFVLQIETGKSTQHAQP